MDSILKPKFAFDTFTCHYEFLDKFNICSFADNLQQGNSTTTIGYYLKYTDWYNKHLYDKLPRCTKFRISECKFRTLNFGYDSWYNYDTDKMEIYIDYCQEFFKRGLESKKVLNLHKKFMKENPEYFI